MTDPVEVYRTLDEAARECGVKAADHFCLHVSHLSGSTADWCQWLDRLMDLLADHVKANLVEQGIFSEHEVLTAQIAASEAFFKRFDMLWHGPSAQTGGRA